MEQRKFDIDETVTCTLGDGIVMEESPNGDGGTQYRVRIDFTDHWINESELDPLVILSEGTDDDTSSESEEDHGDVSPDTESDDDVPPDTEPTVMVDKQGLPTGKEPEDMRPTAMVKDNPEPPTAPKAPTKPKKDKK